MLFEWSGFGCLPKALLLEVFGDTWKLQVGPNQDISSNIVTTHEIVRSQVVQVQSQRLQSKYIYTYISDFIDNYYKLFRPVFLGSLFQHSIPSSKELSLAQGCDSADRWGDEFSPFFVWWETSILLSLHIIRLNVHTASSGLVKTFLKDM